MRQENARTLPAHSEPQITSLEIAARSELQRNLGRTLTEVEWNRAGHNLLKLAEILRAWRAMPRDKATGH